MKLICWEWTWVSYCQTSFCNRWTSIFTVKLNFLAFELNIYMPEVYYVWILSWAWLSYFGLCSFSHIFGVLKKTQAAVSTDTVLSAFPASLAPPTPPDCASWTHPPGVFRPNQQSPTKTQREHTTNSKLPKCGIIWVGTHLVCKYKYW